MKMKIKLPVFCAFTGAAAGLIFWLFLFLIERGTFLVWEMLPGFCPDIPFYPVIICAAGGLLIGIFRKFTGDYPEDMMTVLKRLKTEKTYPYRALPVIFIGALLPLIFGSSVGPEAGMVGVIVALCCLAADMMKFAKKESEDFSRIGAAVSLSVIFRSPLFGILDVEDDGEKSLTGTTKIILYCIATGAGFGCFWLLNTYIEKVSEAFPSFAAISTDRSDYICFVPYLICGMLLGIFFELTEKAFEKAAHALPAIIKETVAGLILGITACFLPVIMFSGEEQMGVLITDYARYAPLAMIGIAFLKIIMTNLCINLGLKGGHFFPLIFAAVCLGYGVSLLIFPLDASHANFAAAVAASGTLGISMKKPLAVSMLLLLCFPAGALLWIVPASALSAWIGMKLMPSSKKDPS